jgi:hypothetical protein
LHHVYANLGFLRGMFGSNRKSHRRIHVGGIATLLVMSSGCAMTPESGNEAQHDACPPGRALICTRWLGREQQCSCELEEGFEEIFEPMRR